MQLTYSAEPHQLAHRKYELVSNYPLALIRMLRDKGYSTKQILEDTNIDYGELKSPTAKVTLEDYLDIIARAQTLTGDQSLGLELGQSLGITSHGMVGVAAMSCSTYLDALKVSAKYFKTRFSPINTVFAYEQNRQYAFIVFEEKFPFTQNKIFILETILASFYDISKFLIGEQAEKIEIELDYDLEYVPRLYKQALGNNITFGAEQCKMRVPAELFDINVRFSEPITYKMAIAKCEDLLSWLDIRQTFETRVSKVIEQSKDGFPSVGEVAEALHMSPRTLRRKLIKENTSFQEIVDRKRRKLAESLLADTDIPIAQISASLQFCDPSYFTRAFKKWTGQSPTQYRKKINSIKD